MEFKTLVLFCRKISGYIVELIVPLNLGVVKMFKYLTGEKCYNAGNPLLLKDLADTEEAQAP